ncbi:uncharacterized protein LOC129001424 [Macrosteles quadrilineatus]|uniref:uncharacterized protein LOC129001424 n=1 Tax=Macrosteles quadrilineatus TaxID=74068 RepID=UPI0023E2DE90|nr:uncharacterized protein LOC129001424 [Macrosteles quadrilineatus]
MLQIMSCGVVVEGRCHGSKSQLVCCHLPTLSCYQCLQDVTDNVMCCGGGGLVPRFGVTEDNVMWCGGGGLVPRFGVTEDNVMCCGGGGLVPRFGVTADNVMCCGGGGLVARLGVTAGLLSLISVVGAVLTGGWLYTREPLTLPGSRTKSCCVTFRIGLWRVCASLKRVLSSTLSEPYILLPMPGCQLIPYSGWREVNEADLGITWSALEFTPSLITKTRYATPLVALATAMLSLANLLVVSSHCFSDLKSLAACGLFTLGGLVLACGLMVFAASLSDVVADRNFHNHLEHRYGASFHAAAAACVLSQAAALLSIVAFLRHFTTVEEMVPGDDCQLHTPPDLCSQQRHVLVLKPCYTTVIHQGLLGVAEGSTSSGSSPSLPRPQNRYLPPRPRRGPVEPIDSPSSESQNT